MKKTAIILFSALSLCAFGQTKKAALTGLSTYKNDITYVGKMPQVTNAAECLVGHGPNYHDTITFMLLKQKVDSILPLMGYRRLPDDSVLKTTEYNELAKKIRAPFRYDPKPPKEVPARGYSYIPWSGLGKVNYAKEFMDIPAAPDLMVVAQAEFDINVSTVGGKDQVNVYCDVFIKAFDKRNKKVFKLHQMYKHPHIIAVKNARTCWGLDYAEDISQYEKEALLGALKKLDEELPQEIADVKEANLKANAKEKEKEDKKKN